VAQGVAGRLGAVLPLQGGLDVRLQPPLLQQQRLVETEGNPSQRQTLLQGGLDACLRALVSQQQRMVSIQDIMHRDSMCMGVIFTSNIAMIWSTVWLQASQHGRQVVRLLVQQRCGRPSLNTQPPADASRTQLQSANHTQATHAPQHRA
jgi:hypothetical protein